MSNNPHPIGIFDSGLGGLSVWKEIATLLPHESIIYYADNANCPYGPRPKEEILALADRVVTFLLEQSCKLIVIACNTATAAAIKTLRSTYSVPFVGMEPAIKPAAQRTLTGKVGILATLGTFNGDHFRQTRQAHASDIEVVVQVGKGLVELVEQGQTTGEKANALLRAYLDPMLAAGVDQIVLGCTHYPFLMEEMERIVQGKATIIDPAPAVARQVKRRLDMHGLEASGEQERTLSFYTSGAEEGLKTVLNQLGFSSLRLNPARNPAK